MASPALADPAIESHEIRISLEPAAQRIEVEDRMVVQRDGGGELSFVLNSNLAISAIELDGEAVEGLEKTADDGWRTTWKLAITREPGPKAVLLIRYAGTIADGVEKSEALGFVVGDSSRGVVCAEGAYLSGGTYWYADDGGLARFEVRADVPLPYSVVTQGSLAERRDTETRRLSHWTSRLPADGLALVAGRWKHVTRQAGAVTLGVYLSEQNAAGADILLDAAEREIATYSELLGPYAYDRFDIVENWFTTGYGMPAFTLLGRHVVARMVGESRRSGRIPPGYLDHEIVHCWWGNLVYPDYATGNWCEGLTSYCSNYLAKERQGPEEARRHRERTCIRYSINVTPERDYPLRKFVGKREDFENDIGYGKASMVFHQLRREIGDDAFWRTLRTVSREHAGKHLGWDGWRAAFEAESQRNLAEFFAQWLERPGAPLLELSDVKVTTAMGRLQIAGVLRQRLAEGEEPWRVTVPIVAELLDGSEELLVDVSTEETSFTMLAPSLPLRVTADPDFHVFRRLGPEEVPPCLAVTLSRPDVLVIHPDDDAALAGVAAMAQRAGARVAKASEAPTTAPAGTSLLILGDAERVPLLAALRSSLPKHFDSRGGETTTILASVRNPADSNEFITTFTGPAEVLAGRARALFYYQYDGRIVFEGRVPKERTAAETPQRTSRWVLPDVRAAEDVTRAEEMLATLTGEGMDGRLAGTDGERRALARISEAFRLAGLTVSEQDFTFTVRRRDIEPVVQLDGVSVADAHPFTASAMTPPEGIVVAGVATDPADELTGRALLLDFPTASEAPLAFARDVGLVARDAGASALLLRLPEKVTPRIAELWETPESLHPDITARLAKRRKTGGHGDALLRASGTAARRGSDDELPLPTLVVPHDFDADAKSLSLRVRFAQFEVTSRNVVARLRAGEASGDGAVLLGAHADHLGPGFPGADDNASGVTALIEAANILSAHVDLIGRDVLFVAFGAEEWGLRGSRHFVQTMKPGSVSAVVNADTIGRRGVADVNIVGISHHPRLARVVEAALAQSATNVGKDIDRFAFAHGSDHWPFHEAGLPAVDLWSGDYRAMHSTSDTLEHVDAKKITRIGRAMAVAALALSLGW